MFKTDSDIVLRSPEMTDVEKILSWENDRDNWLQSGITEPYSEIDIKNYVSKEENLKHDRQIRYMIDLPRIGAIGCVDLFDYDPATQQASVGLLIDKAYRRSGYGLSALKKIASMGRSMYRLKKLKALVLANNVPSVELFKKNGYQSDDNQIGIYRYDNKDYLQITFFKDL